MCSDTVSDAYSQQLYEKFCRGDRRAGIELYNLYSNRLFQYIRRTCIYNDFEEAEECWQNTWTKLFEYCGKPLQAGSLWGFMCKIAKNRAIDDFRARTRQKRSAAETVEYLDEYYHIEAEDEHNWSNPEQQMEAEEEEQARSQRLQAFKQAMALLPDKQRLALTLQLAGYALKEIARQMGEGEETVKSHIRYAKNKLKGVLVS